MGRLRTLGSALTHLDYVRRAIEDKADLSAFREPPSFRLVLGVTLIGLSFLVCWPLISLLGILAIWFREPLIAAIGGPAAYGLSWLIWGAGILIAGKDCVVYPSLFFRWLTRVSVEHLLAQGVNKAASASIHSPSTNDSDSE